MGGAAASAIASDLGARAIREELDALRVMGIDPVRHLVVPRFLALIVIAPILCIVIIASAVAASFCLAVIVSDVTSGSFWMSFGSFAKMVDVWFTIGNRFSRRSWPSFPACAAWKQRADRAASPMP